MDKFDINFKEPLFKIINNVTAKPETIDSENIKRLLIKQIFSTVK